MTEHRSIARVKPCPDYCTVPQIDTECLLTIIAEGVEEDNYRHFESASLEKKKGEFIHFVTAHSKIVAK